MIPSVNLLFGVHNHQPVGNFENIFKKGADDCYRPFINILYNYPQLKATLHFSGSLIDWLLKNDPGLLQKVKQMVKRDQVEILTGGYFEPILPIIPEQDQLGQINMLTDFIKDYFGYEPQGAWIGERVWEPQLTKSLVQAGVRYILLDDFHFRSAGIKKERLSGYYLTEYEGQSLAVFPINKDLRYIIPFSSPAQPIAFLKGLASEQGNAAAIIVDDGEKFGLWPGTHKWVYQKMWLERFFQQLIKNKDWLKTKTLSEFMRRYKPQGVVSLGRGSYEEMMSWSGGDFRNFFSKYPEANNLHKRMLYVSRSLAKEKNVNEQAKRYLYMGQCNCPYWHGVFGGVYLRHLRQSAYKNLIQAESLIEQGKGPRWIESETVDFDADGADEIIIRNPFLNVFVAPAQGGGIFELDYKPKTLNLMDVMTRVPEVYHKKIKAKPRRLLEFKRKEITSIHDLLRSKEKGLENYLVYDSYRRLSLLDHFLPKELTLTDFKALRYEELGDFINAQYNARQNRTEQALSIILERQGRIDYNGKKIPLRISKKISLTDCDSGISIDYKLENLSQEPLETVFAVEFNLSLDYSSKAALHFEQKPDLWTFPLETVSASAEGFERNRQHTVILPHWPIRIEQAWETKITVAVSG